MDRLSFFRGLLWSGLFGAILWVFIIIVGTGLWRAFSG